MGEAPEASGCYVSYKAAVTIRVTRAEYLHRVAGGSVFAHKYAQRARRLDGVELGHEVRREARVCHSFGVGLTEFIEPRRADVHLLTLGCAIGVDIERRRCVDQIVVVRRCVAAACSHQLDGEQGAECQKAL